jgi:hypothetical protein
LPDVLIVYIAIHHGMTLVTGNVSLTTQVHPVWSSAMHSGSRAMLRPTLQGHRWIALRAAEKNRQFEIKWAHERLFNTDRKGAGVAKAGIPGSSGALAPLPPFAVLPSASFEMSLPDGRGSKPSSLSGVRGGLCRRPRGRCRPGASLPPSGRSLRRGRFGNPPRAPWRGLLRGRSASGRGRVFIIWQSGLGRLSSEPSTLPGGRIRA